MTTVLRLRPGMLTAALGMLLLLPVHGEEAEVGVALVRVQRAHYVMGTVFEITAYGEEAERTAQAVEEAFAVIRHADEVMSHYRDESELMEVNRRGGREAVPVPAELYAVLEASLRYGELSGGAFDITVAPLVQLWKRAAERGRLPSNDEMAAARRLVGFRQLQLLPVSRVQFARDDMQINLGAIGKGWAVDRAVEVLRAGGIRNAFVSAGSSTVYGLGAVPGEPGWPVDIRDPCGPEGSLERMVLKDASLSTSASYEQYSEIEGQRYSHIIDPRTGWPTEPLASATVVAPTATEADALSTAVYVLGLQEGQALLRQHGLEGLLVERRQPESCIVHRVQRAEGSTAMTREYEGTHDVDQ